MEEQALIDQHAQNIERIRQQVMAEADTSHHRKKNINKKSWNSYKYMKQMREEEFNKHNIKQNKKHKHILLFFGRNTEFAEHQYRKEGQQK